MSKGYKRQIVLDFDYDQVKEGIPQVNKQMQLLNAEYSAAQAEIKATGEAVDEYANRQKYLEERIKITKTQLEQNNQRLAEATEKHGEGSKQVENYNSKVAVTEARLKQLENELVGVNLKLEEQKTVLGKTSDEWKSLGDKTTSVGKKMSMGFTVPIVAAGTAAFKMGADYEQALGKLETVFGENSVIVTNWANNSLKNFGLARTTATQMVGDFGALFDGMGITMTKSREWSMELTERTMDISNFYDTTVDETITALNSIVSGQTEPLRKFGINMTQASLQEFAYSKNMRKKIEDMTEAEKVQLRYNFVMDRTAIAVGTTAKESDSATGMMNRLKETTKDLSEGFGTLLIPVLVPIIEALVNFLGMLNGLDDGTKKFIITILGLVATIGPMLIMIGKVFNAFSQVNDGIKAGQQLIGGLSKVGKGFSGLLGNTQFLGFAKWALIIAGVATAIYLVISALNDLIGRSSSANQLFSQIGNVTGQVQGAVNGSAVRGYAVGSKFIEYDQLAYLHKGEAVLRADENPNNPANNGKGYGGGVVVNMYVQAETISEINALMQMLRSIPQVANAGMVIG